MKTTRSKIVRLSSFQLEQLVDPYAGQTTGLSYSCALDDDNIHIVRMENEGEGLFDEKRTVIEKEVMVDYVKKRYSIAAANNWAIKKIEDEDCLEFKFTVDDGSTTGDREPAASNASVGPDIQAPKRARGSRPKGTGEKLPVLPDGIHPRV